VRWKLLLAASLVASVVGAGGCYGLVYAVRRLSQLHPSALTALVISELVPVAASVSAAVFVYRHTARRRKLQAVLTLLLGLALAQVLIRAVAVFAPL
jgi:hypothetical protein